MCVCEGKRMWRCEDVKDKREREREDVWRCEDVKMWRWEGVKIWRCEYVKLRRCEDMKVWVGEDEKMWACEDVRMWRFEHVKMYSRPPLLEELFAQTLSGINKYQAEACGLWGGVFHPQYADPCVKREMFRIFDFKWLTYYWQSTLRSCMWWYNISLPDDLYLMHCVDTKDKK